MLQLGPPRLKSTIWLQVSFLAMLIGGVAAEFISALKPCPVPCEGGPENWTVYHSVDRLTVCDQPLLLDFALHTPLDDRSRTVKLRACTARGGDANTTRNALLTDGSDSTNFNSSTNGGSKRSYPVSNLRVSSKRQNNHSLSKRASCGSASSVQKVTTEIAWPSSLSPSSQPRNSGDIQQILAPFKDYLGDPTQCDSMVMVGYHKGLALGVYSGSAIDNVATIPSVLDLFADRIASHAPQTTMLIQLSATSNSSDTGGLDADYLFGATSDSLAGVQRALLSWTLGRYVDTKGYDSTNQPLTVYSDKATTGNQTLLSTRSERSRQLQARADCKTIKVKSGDGCDSLAKRCGISPADFTKYNPSPTLCSSLAIGQMVCCSAGTLPDIRPKPNADGSCASYTIKSADSCDLIAAKNGLTVTELESFNNGTAGTWGWMGCGNLFSGINICLSTGRPPMPAPMPNATCGPTVPGSQPPAAGQNLADLNPCPLHACCNIWGQCGIDSDFCILQPGPSGNPGTSPPGTDGCVSSCGTDIINNANKPAEFKSVGYYESWNWDRECLFCRAGWLPSTTNSLTHLHWAFGDITDGFNVEVNDTHQQWDDFKALPYKRIISFGGWGYSTDPATYDILRKAMKPANQQTFAQNIVNFLNANGLDGVDIDWEYPGAPDIPGIPPGLASDGPNYLGFLTTLRGIMPPGKSISIAAPASYWYLKAFPIADMAKVLDYIVYMTYDLHGQWDYGSTWASSGCLGGNCLRSHVNITETMLALSMITKAGVPTSSICVGVSSYGRSFQMTTAGCDGPDCLYTGPDSGATAGRCTAEPGYIANAEIYEIIETQKGVKVWRDDASASNMIVYNDNQWVAYMDDTEKAARIAQYQSLNFGGSVDWAVDLQEFTDADTVGATGDDIDYDIYPIPWPPCDAVFTSLDDLDTNIPNADPRCQAQYVLQTLSALYHSSMAVYNDMIANNYDAKFRTYSNAVADSAATQVEDFVRNNGNKYFNCVVVEEQFCCDKCNQIGGGALPNPCKYCFNSGKCYKNKRSLPSDMSPAIYVREGAPPVGNNPNVQYLQVPEPCPPDYSQRGISQGVPEDATVYWTLAPGAQTDAFWADLFTNVGIEQQYIAFVDHNNYGCQPSDSTAECQLSGWDMGIPAPQGYNASDIADPRDTVQAALAKSDSLGTQIDDAVTAILTATFMGDPYAVIDAVSMPVLMIAQSVESMQQVEDAAHEIDEEKRKQTILAWLGAILFAVPIAGELLGSIAALANVGRIISLMGALGNAAQDIYTIVTDPSNAPLAIVDLVLTPLSLGDVVKMNQASDLRRGMADEDVAKMGTKIAERMKSIQKCTGVCMKKA